ncbi:Fur family transcriptional regulator [Burkholderia multivorans]|uniref:Fur family transcriptional regulator n=1 Tax=Burkholderia multivorans TaxID=87883 RepID=UPI00158B85FE|nr:transcriptional repressor [Burkholderia multivorans]
MASHDDPPRIIDLITSFGNKSSPSSKRMKHIVASVSSETHAPKSPHEKRLAASHLRPTIARISVLDALEKAGPRCLDATQMYRNLSPQFENISPAVIYRALNDLWTAGLLIRTEGERGRALYAVKPDRKSLHYDTLRCHCGARLVFIENPALREHLRLLAGEEGFDLDKEPAFTITMTCAGCQSLRKGDR